MKRILVAIFLLSFILASIQEVGDKVGINTTEPQATLHVSGDLRVDGKIQGANLRSYIVTKNIPVDEDGYVGIGSISLRGRDLGENMGTIALTFFIQDVNNRHHDIKYYFLPTTHSIDINKSWLKLLPVSGTETSGSEFDVEYFCTGSSFLFRMRRTPSSKKYNRLWLTIRIDVNYMASFNSDPNYGMMPTFISFPTNGINKKTPLTQINGKVGIGVAHPSYNLTVEGTIAAREILVTQEKWADFVFAKDYKLRSLMDVESFIKQNRHLPDMPSEQEVIGEQVNVAEIQMKLLQKIEELTIYTIQQQKTIAHHSERIEDLENLLEDLLNR